MPYNVSSWFVDQCKGAAPPVLKRFYLGTSDYTDRVAKWPSLSRKWDDVKPVTISIGLINDDQGFNFFHTDKTNLASGTSKVQMGFTHPTSGPELLTLFQGTTKKVSYAGGMCTLTLGDKYSGLSERIVGASNSAAVFSSATLLASDIAWTLCTCYGGLSSVASTSNPDIDYANFQTWAAVFSGDTVYMSARFEGQKVTEALRKLAQQSLSAIVLDGDKLSFFRFTSVNTLTVDLSQHDILNTALEIDDEIIVNRQYVFGAFDINSKVWAVNAVAAASASINSFGLRENILSDESVWYVASQHAYSAAQRMLRTNSVPFDALTVETTLAPLPQRIGDVIVGHDAFLGIDAGWRIMEQHIDLDSGKLSFKIDPSQINTPFILDASSLDGTDVLL